MGEVVEDPEPDRTTMATVRPCTRPASAVSASSRVWVGRILPDRSTAMSPHRLSAAAIVADSVARVPAILLTPGIALCAGLLSGLCWAIGAANMRLLGILTGAMLLNLAIGGLWAMLDPKQTFSARKLYAGFWGKILRLLAVPLASVADWLFIVSPFGGGPPLSPEDYAFPVAAFVLWGLCIAELVSSIQKLVEARVLPESVGAALVARLQATRPDSPAPGPREEDRP